MHANEPTTFVLSKKKTESAAPSRPQASVTNKLDEHEEIAAPETSKLDISIKVAEARLANGYKTRKDLARAMNISVDFITCIESRKGKLDKQILNKTCQFLKIKTT